MNKNKHTHPAREGFRTTFLGILVSVGLAIGKAAAGFLGHSFALIADAVESVGEAVESQAIQADAFHHRSDAITSAAAFIGISIALIGGKGYEIADDWAALVSSAIILYNAWTIAKPALGELMDKQPDPEWLSSIEDVALAHPEV